MSKVTVEGANPSESESFKVRKSGVFWVIHDNGWYIAVRERFGRWDLIEVNRGKHSSSIELEEIGFEKRYLVEYDIPFTALNSLAKTRIAKKVGQIIYRAANREKGEKTPGRKILGENVGKKYFEEIKQILAPYIP